MNEEKAKSDNGIDWYVVAVLWAMLLAFLIAIATGCETIHGFGMDLTKSTEKYCEHKVFEHP